MFACIDGTTIMPLEFSAEHNTHYQSALTSVLAAPGFVAAYTAALAELGVTALVGLALLPPASECAPRGAQWMMEQGSGAGRGLVTTVYLAGDGPADASVLDGSHDVVWVATASLDAEAATQRKCNPHGNARCHEKQLDECDAYATQRKCNPHGNARCREKQ